MRTRSSFVLFIVIALLFLSALGYEVFKMTSARQDAMGALATAQEKLGIDSWSRSIRSIQIDEKTSLDTVDQAIMTRAGLVNLIELLETTGKDLGLNIVISSVRDDPKQKTEVRVAIDTVGTWEPSLRFLHMLQNLPYKTNIEDSVLNAEDGKWHGTATLHITLAPENIQN